jgi:WD40 repeat protein
MTAAIARAETAAVPNAKLITTTPPFTFGLVWNQDSTRIAGFTGVGKGILVWDRDGHLVREFNHPEAF